ncbi:VOC family protein [Virgibacillus phasianinus]|nr:VOC family protein [Virgibacillus phasianinus]
MKLVFLFYPVKDLHRSLAFYKKLGMEEDWWADKDTVALNIPGSDVKLMLEKDESEEKLTPGGMFLINSVEQFYRKHKEDFHFVIEPCDVPPGRYAAFEDESGKTVRVVDGTKNNNFFNC